MEVTAVDEIEADNISAWFAHMRTTPGATGKVRCERTIQTYARSGRVFFHWLIRRGTLETNPFDRVVFPKESRPLIKTISDEEFEQLLFACAPPNEIGPSAERAAVRNHAILWLLYDTGIRVSELINLRVGDFDRKHNVITVMGKGSKERRVALGQNCVRNLSYYLDKHRPDEEELAEWGSAGEDHLFLYDFAPSSPQPFEQIVASIQARHLSSVQRTGMLNGVEPEYDLGSVPEKGDVEWKCNGKLIVQLCVNCCRAAQIFPSKTWPSYSSAPTVGPNAGRNGCSKHH